MHRREKTQRSILDSGSALSLYFNIPNSPIHIPQSSGKPASLYQEGYCYFHFGMYNAVNGLRHGSNDLADPMCSPHLPTGFVDH